MDLKFDVMFDVIFDNGGGVTLQVGKGGFAHYYENNPRQCAEDVAVLLAEGNTNDWEGDEPEARMSYCYETERNGGYAWHDQDDVKRIAMGGMAMVKETSWDNLQEFYKTLLGNLPPSGRR